MPSAPWKTTTATVLSSEFHYTRLKDLDLESSEDKSFHAVHFRYTVDGKDYFDSMELYDPLNPGEELAISYNPENPQENTASQPKLSKRGRTIAWIAGVAILALLIHLSNRLDIPLE
jgi:hypothetical protein